ncbi:MAG: 6-hydroxymethylpterin diphosphokinase MptE-like protein [Chlamydiota bacterium]
MLSRFPEIGFILSLEQEEEVLSEEPPLQGWVDPTFLEGVDVLYVYGIVFGSSFQALTKWLEGKKGRTIVFFEESLATLRTLFSLPQGLDVLQNPQIHVQFLTKPFNWDDLFEDCVKRWISDRVEFLAAPSYLKGQEKKIKKLRVKLLSKSALMSVAITESLHYHRLMENISLNFLTVPKSFHVNQWSDICKNIPAIICGAGVSLAEAAKLLKGLDSRALIIAGGSAITALHHFGIRPHIAMALDPNEEEYGRMKSSGSFEVPFVYSSRLHKEVLTSTNVAPGYLCSDTGGAFESWMHEELNIDVNSLGPELGVEALSVTTLAVPLAKFLGCNPILFCGVDLSYKDMQRYPPGVVSSAKVFLEEMQAEKRSMEKLIRKKNAEGHFVYTLVKWVMEASCIGNYAKAHKQIKFFNASSGGLSIPSVSQLSLKDFIELYCQDQHDLRGRLHAEGELARFSDFSLQDVKKAFSKLEGSLRECLPILEDMLQEIERKQKLPFDPKASQESGKMQVLEMDLVEQPSYSVCLESVFCVYQRILDRCYPCDPYLEAELVQKNGLEKKKQLWTECQKVLKACLAVLEKHTGKKDEDS